jgi:acyl carrier protein
MEENQKTRNIPRERILFDLTEILSDMTSDWDNEVNAPIGSQTKLIGDLCFESIDIVQFVVAIQECYQRRDLPFEEVLMSDGRYVDEIVMSDVVDFLYRHLNK